MNHRLHRVRLVPALLAGFAFGLALLAPAPARAQSCILTRLNTPLLNAFNPVTGGEKKWQVSIAYRYGRSDRHFVGTVEQTQRTREHSQVINTVHLLDLGLRYNFSAQNSIEVGVPYLMATRSGPLRGDNREVIGRVQRSSPRGIGDLTAIAHHLFWNPQLHPRSNLSLGLGIKLPTGDDNVQGTRLSLDDNGDFVATTRTADESVQPGDGGFGAIVDLSGYKVLNHSGSFAGYFSGLYIIAPGDTNGVFTYRGAPGEEFVSITDQYVARLGVEFGPASWNGFSVGLGERMEGIPVHDLIGDSNGFRRPGYILSVEPSMSWTHGPNTVSLAVPYAIQRDRQRSVPDIRRGAHGDAAFPDWIAIVGFYHSF